MVVADRIIRAADKNRAASQLRCFNLGANAAALFFFAPLFLVTAFVTWRCFRKLPADSQPARHALRVGVLSIVASLLTVVLLSIPFEITSPTGFNPYVLIASLAGLFCVVGLVPGIVFMCVVDKELWRLTNL